MSGFARLRGAAKDLRRAPRLLVAAGAAVALAGVGLAELARLSPVTMIPAHLGLALVVFVVAGLALHLARALVLVICNRGEPSLVAAVRLVPRIITVSVVELLPLVTLAAAGLLGSERLLLDGETRRWVYALLLAPPLALAFVVVAIGRVALVLLPRTTSPLVAFAKACALVLAQPYELLRLLAAWLATTLPLWLAVAAFALAGARGFATVAGALAIAWLYALLSRWVAEPRGGALSTLTG